jgi:hypothetical protein
VSGAPNGETAGTPRDGVTAGRATFAMLRAKGAEAGAGLSVGGAEGADAAGRRLTPPGDGADDGADGIAVAAAKGIPARAGPVGAVGAGAAAGREAASVGEAGPVAGLAAELVVACVADPLAASMAMKITPPQTEHRARTPPAGTRAGSTRKTDRHSPQATFTGPPRSPRRRRV